MDIDIDAEIAKDSKEMDKAEDALELLVLSGQSEDPLLSKVKFDAMLGLFPILGTGKLRAAFPTFCTVTVFGLSLPVEPKLVVAKLRLGGSLKYTFHTLLAAGLEAKTFPLESTAIPSGSLKPLASVLWM